jgi:hypothetical protein
MAEYFGMPQVLEYLKNMGLRLAYIDEEQQIIELAFHGNHGQWRMIVGIQQSGEARKLMMIAPHIGTLSTQKRLECLEALMTVNYRIAMGKFGLDLEDGEVRLEEGIPLANDGITYEQFQLAFGAIMQTVAMYHSLIPRIVYGNASIEEALKACEQEFLEELNAPEGDDNTPTQPVLPGEPRESAALDPLDTVDTPVSDGELNVGDVLAEISRILEERND